LHRRSRAINPKPARSIAAVRVANRSRARRQQTKSRD
jgi:hypothetical protein